MPYEDRALPKYLQIAGHIRDQIVRGDLPPGAEVPSERELAVTWRVARPTAARALAALRTQGLVTSRRGSGTYVKAVKAAPRARERYARAADLDTMYGPGETVEFLAIGRAPAPEHVADALGTKVGAEVLRRARRLRNAEGRPIELSTSWFSGSFADLAPRLLEPERIRGGTSKYVSEVTGVRTAYGRDQVAARLATPQEADLLTLDPPAAVLIYRFTVYADDDRPLQTDDAVYPSDLWTLRDEYPLTDLTSSALVSQPVR